MPLKRDSFRKVRFIVGIPCHFGIITTTICDDFEVETKPRREGKRWRLWESKHKKGALDWSRRIVDTHLSNIIIPYPFYTSLAVTQRLLEQLNHLQSSSAVQLCLASNKDTRKSVKPFADKAPRQNLLQPHKMMFQLNMALASFRKCNDIDSQIKSTIGTFNRLVDLVISLQDPRSIDPWSLQFEHGKHPLQLSPKVLEWRVYSSHPMANDERNDRLDWISRNVMDISTYKATSTNGPDLVCAILGELHHTLYNKLPDLIHELDIEFEKAVDAGMVYENIVMFRARDGRTEITEGFLEMFNIVFQHIQAQSAQKAATIGTYLEDLVQTMVPTGRKLTSAVIDGLWESQVEALRHADSKLLHAIKAIPGKIHEEEMKQMQHMAGVLRDVDRFKEDLDKLYARSNTQLKEWGTRFKH